MLSICILLSYQGEKSFPYDLTDFPSHLLAQNCVIGLPLVGRKGRKICIYRKRQVFFKNSTLEITGLRENISLGTDHSKPMQFCYLRTIKVTRLMKNTSTIKSPLVFSTSQ